MRRIFWAVACVVLLSMCVSALAADNTGLMGKNELMAAGAWIKASNDGDVKATLLGANYGKFIDNNLQVQMTALYGNIDLDSFSAHAYLLGPAAVYHFVPKNSASATIPYVGIGGIYANVSGGGESDSSLKLQYMAGVKFFIGGDVNTANKTVFIEYRRTNIDVFDADISIDMLWSGISVLF